MAYDMAELYDVAEAYDVPKTYDDGCGFIAVIRRIYDKKTACIRGNRYIKK